MTREELAIVLKEYGQAAALGAVALDEGGHALLFLTADLPIHLFLPPGSEDFMVLADLGPLPPAEKAALVLEDLLTANYLSRADREGILTVLPESGRVFLMFRPGPAAAEAEVFFWFMKRVETLGLAWRSDYSGLLEGEDDLAGGLGQATAEEPEIPAEALQL